MGKTSFALNIANQIISTSQYNIYFFSLEMSKKEILDKLIALNSNIPLNNLNKQIIKKYEWDKLQNACKKLIQSQLYIDDQGYTSINYIKSQIENYTKKKTIIIIDYLQLIKTDNSYNSENRSQEIGYITRELKLLAKNSASPIIILSQLNRNIENRINKRPMLSDLRESGCFSTQTLNNLYQISTFKLMPSIIALDCLKNFYTVHNNTQIDFKLKYKQYLYLLTTTYNTLLSITHNHKILTGITWQKEDQVKRHSMHSLCKQNILNSQYLIELHIFNIIKLLYKETVYDVTIYEYCHFISKKQILHNSIEQDADLVLMLYKENEKNNNSIQTLDIIIAKHRNGPIGTFQLLFHTEICQFRNINDNTFQIISNNLPEY